MYKKILKKLTVALSITLSISGISVPQVTWADNTSATGVDVSEEKDGSVLADYDTTTGVLRIYPYGSSGTKTMVGFWGNYNGVSDVLGVSAETFKSVVIDNGVKAPSDSSICFRDFKNVEEMDISGLDTSSVTDMSGMFEGCSSLKNINISNFDTSNVTDMGEMFKGCSSLESINVSNFNTSKVTYMFGMFKGCSSLKNIDVSNFDTSNVTDIEAIFEKCSSLKKIDISAFILPKAEEVSGLFSDCSSLTEVNMSNIDMQTVSENPSFFGGNDNLKKIDMHNVDLSGCKEFNGLFEGLENLEELNCSGVKTTNARDMQRMFSDCKKLKKLDLSSFETRKLRYSDEMFSGCEQLESLDISNFDMSNIIDCDGMFEDLDNLKILKSPKIIPSGKCADYYVENSEGYVYRWRDSDGYSYVYLPRTGKTLYFQKLEDYYDPDNDDPSDPSEDGPSEDPGNDPSEDPGENPGETPVNDPGENSGDTPGENHGGGDNGGDAPAPVTPEVKVPSAADPYSSVHDNDGSSTVTISSGNAKFVFDAEKANTVVVAKTYDISKKLSSYEKDPAYDSSAKHRYIVDNKKAATINKKGILKPKKCGEINISLEQKVNGGAWTKIGNPIHMYVQLPEMKKKESATAGDKLDAYSFLSHTTYSPTKWESSNTSVATIDENGKITILKKGNTQIIAVYGEGSKSSKRKYKTALKVNS